MNKVLRQEVKYLINVEDYIAKRHILDQVLHQDPHNGVNGYMVRSLYFDTLYDRDYFEKLDGLETRRKIRLRIYHPGSSYALLEMKQKQGDQQLKRSVRLSREDAQRMIRGDYSPLLHCREDFARECYALMESQLYLPKTIVQYHRKAYIAKENKIRVTFDSAITASESNLDLFASDLIMHPVLTPFNVVMEVKYNGFLLEYIRRLLDSADKSPLSVSKYYLARQQSCRTTLM